MSQNAYWLDPRGKIIKPEARHISTILRYPKQFGETDTSINKSYEKHHEKVSSTVEGKAREEIMLRVIRRGFVRIRFGGTRNSQKWSVQLQKLTPKLEDALWMWAAKITKQGTNDKYADVVIHELGRGDKMTRTSLNKVASGGSIKEEKFFTDEEIDNFRIYCEADLRDFPRWVDYAHEIDPNQLHESATVEILAHRFRG